jgi:hypothetical protein
MRLQRGILMRRMIGIAACVLALVTTVVWAAPTGQATLFQLFLLEARVDLERLADEAFGEEARPQTWTFNTDLESDKVAVDLWFDNEQLADEVFGDGQRPVEWFGATTPDPELLARNVRHDMELTADAVFTTGQRPQEWNGAPPIYRCDRTLQNLVRLLDRIYNVRPTTSQAAIGYCAVVAREIENELLPGVFERLPDDELPGLVWALRGDLERLANELLGVNERPSGWIGNIEEDSPTLAADTSADLELLADAHLGAGVRPEEWNQFIPASIALSYRNLRFNLELLADLSLGEDVRPGGWQGEDPLTRCDTTTQALALLLERNFDYTVDPTFVTVEEFCSLTEFTVNNVAENPPRPVAEAADLPEPEDVDTRYVGESNWAFSYLDVAALQYMGTMPQGVEFRAWYRNFGGSTMMFVSGDNFALFVDHRFTTLPENVFRDLPTLEGVRPLTFCDARWCNGPGPTPTPTGAGALMALVVGATPPAPADVQEIERVEGKVPVSWNNIRVTYLLDRLETGTVQVALEICAEPQQIACEPVTSVFDQATGTTKPVLSQYNGLNVYEFRYGFNDQVVVEGATRVASAIFLSDPTIR